MTKEPKSESGQKAKADKKPPPEVELVPDAWERFEKAVGKVAASKPMPKTGKPSATPAGDKETAPATKPRPKR